MAAPTANTIGHSHATEHNTASRLPIFAAKYRDRAIAILKRTDYHAVVSLIRAAFEIPTVIPDSQIRLSSRFDEFGDLLVELVPDVWDEISPLLKIVEVSTSPRPLAHIVVPDAIQPQQPNNEAEGVASHSASVVVHIIGGPKDLSIPISDTCTLSELKALASRYEARLPSRLAFHYQDNKLDDDTKLLKYYGIVDQSIITMITSVQVYVTTPARSKVPMRITLYAGVSSLKLLIYAQLDIQVHEQILMCAGEELVDGTQLGSYPQVCHNCQIVVDVVPAAETGGKLGLLCVKVKPAWATNVDDEDGQEYYVLPNSTILDLKVLIYNSDLISPPRQHLEFRGQGLDDEQNMNEAQVESGSILIMHITSQRT
ncbi:unnamed protein product [Rhizoctonia solani]|uniref:Ubiquitin-like domain-containing protein n=1 Tax=Rhizoctonia solani TaxID=456999 RepID=A0A8H3GZ96_9AGAM|nr:unnamed protein product [Rhizoctonia solani]